MTPDEAASTFVTVHRCLGNLASGNDGEMHKDCEPGGYDVIFAIMPINHASPFKTFEEAKRFAIGLQKMIGLAIRYDREGLVGKSSREPWDIESLQEADLFCGRSAYATAERFVERLPGRPKLFGDPRRCRYGWVARWCARNAKIGNPSWRTWERKMGTFVLVVPPTAAVFQLPMVSASSLDEALQMLADRSELQSVYKIDPDYDTLVNAGVEGWRAESVLAGIQVHVDVAYGAYKRGSFDPAYAEAARAILERVRTTEVP